MRAIAATLLSAIVLLAAAAPSAAGDQARFEQLIRKYVPDYTAQFTSFAPKTPCICEPEGRKAAGVLLSDSGYVGCLVPVFMNGDLQSFQSCASYVVLGR